jgi:hypothetical protein
MLKADIFADATNARFVRIADLSSTLYYVDNCGNYEVVLDAGREVRRQLGGCEVNPWRPKASSYRVTGWVEFVAN